MITRVQIQGFRGVREGQVEGLAPISILVGPNNTGKSTVLEAVALVSKEPDPGEVTKLLRRRGGPQLDAFEHIVHHGEKEARIEVQEKVKDELTADWLMTMSTSRVLIDRSDNDGKPMKGPRSSS